MPITMLIATTSEINPILQCDNSARINLRNNSDQHC